MTFEQTFREIIT